jgi:phenylacetate-CoA ligase
MLEKLLTQSADFDGDATKTHEREPVMIHPLIADCPAQRHATLEFQSPDEIRRVQDELLVQHVRYAAQHSPFYRERFRQAGLDPAGVQGITDLAGLPCTEKADLTERNEYFLAVPPEEIVDVCLTSATTGTTPTQLLQTAGDLARLAYNEQQAFGMLGVGPSTTLLVGAALDRCFMAGLAYFLGAVRLGARAVRAGAGSEAQHWQTIRATHPDTIMCVPSLMRRIAEKVIEMGEDPREAGIRRLIGIGESTRDASLALLPAGQKIEELWGATLYSTYASTEIAATFCECRERRGGHLRAELLVVEILNEENRPVAEGELGEVVVTPLGVQGMPLIRFRTGDISYRMDSPCACGRNTPRLAPIVGRKNQMLKYKGTTLFPSTLLAALEGREDVLGVFVEARRNPDGTDRVVACVALRDGIRPEQVMDSLCEQMRAYARVVPEIEFVSPEMFEQRVHQSGKRKRVTFHDFRNETQG